MARIAGVAKRFVTEGLEAALGRKKQENYHRKATACKEKVKPKIEPD